VASGYSTGIRLEKGTRATGLFADRLLKELLGCEQIWSNNCAAALFLALNTLAEGAGVVISRGELIEIGDSFRIPDILRKSGVVLKVVRQPDAAGGLCRGDLGTDQAHRGCIQQFPHRWIFRPTCVGSWALAKEHSLLLEDVGGGCLVICRILVRTNRTRVTADRCFAGLPMTTNCGRSQRAS
jgi:hypothetical protein